MAEFRKYPRTRHLQGSCMQVGDEDIEVCNFYEIEGQYIVVEEKVDGANSGILFNEKRELVLHSRGHTLQGGFREQQFALMKAWAPSCRDALWDILNTRYIMYGEWMLAKHTEFYDELPHYFLEFDIFDTKNEEFLSTKQRHFMLQGTGIVSVPVLWSGIAISDEHLLGLVGNSKFKGPCWLKHLEEAIQFVGCSESDVKHETGVATLMEGIYIKAESNNVVLNRLKYVRKEFTQSILASGSHWMDRPIIKNRLAKNADIWIAKQ